MRITDAVLRRKEMNCVTSNNEERLPATFRAFVEKFPDLADAHEAIGKAVDEIGPLDAKTRALIKIGICLGAGLESALRSHVRRAMQSGASEAEIDQAILLGMNTCGFPRTAAAWQWACRELGRGVGEHCGDPENTG
jgi:alkylhydroperoxidase/carboxymuconolactone decarboxylase family protein YurZ